jgi:hypothetical protein
MFTPPQIGCTNAGSSLHSQFYLQQWISSFDELFTSPRIFQVEIFLYFCSCSTNLHPESPPPSRSTLFPLPLIQQLLNMPPHPISLQPLPPYFPRTPNQALTPLTLTQALKRLTHFPLRARVKKRQLLALLDAFFANTDFPALHIEHDTGVARMVDVDEIAIEFNVEVATRLDGTVCHGCGCRG